MKAVKCACCSESMKRKGKTSSGAQRWRASRAARAARRPSRAMTRPRPQAGRELYGIALDLTRIETLEALLATIEISPSSIQLCINHG